MQEQVEDEGMYRSGVAARLAGIAPQTLRVWERRYAISQAQRAPSGHRLYSSAQVHRLQRLKQLVDQGHAIGVLVGLTDMQLEGLAQGGQAGQAQAPIRLAVVGAGLVQRLVAGLPLNGQWDIAHRWQGMDQLPREDALDADLLLIEKSELDEAALMPVRAVRDAWPSMPVLLLYRFSASATIRLLREAGCTVARMPIEVGELLALCQATMRRRDQAAPAAFHHPAARFDETQLTRLATQVNTVRCECPRHLAELLLMVGSFERYSEQCASRDAADAQMHRDLQDAAAQARTTLEVALEKLLYAEGMSSAG